MVYGLNPYQMYPMMYPSMYQNTGNTNSSSSPFITPGKENSNLDPYTQSYIDYHKAMSDANSEVHRRNVKNHNEILKINMEATAERDAYQVELDKKNADVLRKLAAAEDKKLAEAKLVALNLQSVLRAGNMDLLEDAYYRYIKALTTIPEIKAEFCGGGDAFLDKGQEKAVAMKMYASLLAQPGEKGVVVEANMLEDANLLPGAFSQAMWNGATFGFFKKDHKGTALKLLTGQDISKEDQLASDVGQLLGRTAMVGTLGYAGGRFLLPHTGIAESYNDLVNKIAAERAGKDAIAKGAAILGFNPDQRQNAIYRSTIMKGIVDKCKKQISTIEKDLTKVEAQLKDINTKLVRTDIPKEELEKLTNKRSQLLAKQVELNSKLKTLNDRLVRNTRRLNTYKQQINESLNGLETAYKNVQNEADKAVKALEKLKSLEDAAGKAQDEYDALLNKKNILKNDIKGLEQQLNDPNLDDAQKTNIKNQIKNKKDEFAKLPKIADAKSTLEKANGDYSKARGEFENKYSKLGIKATDTVDEATTKVNAIKDDLAKASQASAEAKKVQKAAAKARKALGKDALSIEQRLVSESADDVAKSLSKNKRWINPRTARGGKLAIVASLGAVAYGIWKWATE